MLLSTAGTAYSANIMNCSLQCGLLPAWSDNQGQGLQVPGTQEGACQPPARGTKDGPGSQSCSRWGDDAGERVAQLLQHVADLLVGTPRFL